MGRNEDGSSIDATTYVCRAAYPASILILSFGSAFALVGYFILVMISYTSSYVVSLILKGITPLCTMPLLSMMSLCTNISPAPVYVQEPRYPDLVNLQTRFESLMESTGYGINLALDMKNSEMAVRDLNTMVRTYLCFYSDAY